LAVNLITRLRFAERFLFFFLAVLFLASECHSYGPTIPKEQIPHDISTEIRGYISDLYSFEAEKRSLAILQLDAAGTQAQPSIPFLLSMLSDMAEAERHETFGDTIASYAANALARMGGKAPDHLNLALKSSEVMVRVNAAGALGLVGDPAAVRPLIELLDDSHKEVRLAAAEALGRIGDARAIKPLIAMLENDGRTTNGRRDMERGAKSKEYCPLKWADESGIEEDEKAEAPCSAPETAELMEFTSGADSWTAVNRGVEDRDVLMSASKALAAIGERSIGPLLAALQSSNQMIRAHAAASLKAFQDDRIAPALNKLLTDPEAHVRGHAVEALAKIGDAGPALSAVVNRREDRVVRLRALIVLQNYWANGKGRDEWLPKLAGVLNDSDTLLSRGVAAIFKTAGPKSTELLITALSESGARARKLAALTLGSKQAREAFDQLAATLKDENSDVRTAAAKALGMLGDSRAVEPLIASLENDESQLTRQAAAKSLGMLDSTFAAPHLEKAILRDESRDVAWFAANALASLRRDAPLQRLLSLLEPHFVLKLNTFLKSFQQALGYRTIGESETIALSVAMRAENVELREFAAEMLAKSHDPLAAAKALKTAVTRDPNPRVRRKAIGSLGRLDVNGCVDLFSEVLEKDQDAGVRKRAVIALGLANDRDAVAALTKALNDSDRGVRAIAAMQLSKQ